MTLTLETFRQLSELYAQGPSGRKEAHRRAREISRDELAVWLGEQVANPAAARHLLELYHGPSGVVDGGASEYQRFYRELGLRLGPQLRRHVIEGGEISRVMYLTSNSFTTWRHPKTHAPMPVVYKRMPPFLHRADAEDYVERYLEYNKVLSDEIGIAVPHFEARIVEQDSQVIIYVIQEQVDAESVCHRILQSIDPQAAERLYIQILNEYAKLYRFNQAHAADGYLVGLDGQIPNWAVANYGGQPDSLTGEERLLYLDTNVPMIRIDRQDVVSTDMYFQALPGLARWIIKRFNLDQEVMDRYFQMRVIILDFMSNIILHHRADLVPRFIEISNEALAGPFVEEGYEPFTLKEIQSYYRSDVALWRLWRSLKLLGAMSDNISRGEWHALRRVGEFYHIWTKPIQ